MPSIPPFNRRECRRLCRAANLNTVPVAAGLCRVVERLRAAAGRRRVVERLRAAAGRRRVVERVERTERPPRLREEMVIECVCG